MNRQRTVSSEVKRAARRTYRQISRDADHQTELLHEAAYYITHGDLARPLEEFSNRKLLMKKRFISGVINGVVTVVGITLALTIVAAILGTAGQHWKGPIGDFARKTSHTLEQKAAE